MDFQPTEERRMLHATLTRYLADRCPLDHRNKVAYSPPFHDPDRWAELVELGLLHALIPEPLGGFGGEGFDIATVFEALGAALCPEPVMGNLMAARILAEDQGGLEDMLTGKTRYAVAIAEPGGFGDLSEVSATATETTDGWRLNGRKCVVYGGNAAQQILVAARGPDGLAALEIDTNQAELSRYGLVDGGGAADLFLQDAPARLVQRDAEAALRDALDWGALALCAEAVGAMDSSAAMLLDYLKTRRQFGRPIGDFQVLQHRMVDILIEIEQARSITILAASRMGTDQQSRTVSMAKSLVGRTAQQTAEELIQMHGGIAMTWEYPASHFAKRLVMIDHQLGDSDQHIGRVAATYLDAG